MKKIIAFAASAALMLSAVNVSVHAEPYIDDLQKFNIIEKADDLRLNDNLTRAEALKMICAACGAGDVDHVRAYQIFPDVPADHWAAKYIVVAHDADIISGDENGNFNPEGLVTYQQFIKMLVSTLGYNEEAAAYGSYPKGYMVYAHALALLDDAGSVSWFDEDAKKPITRDTAMQLLYKALDVPIKFTTQINAEPDGTFTPIVEIHDGVSYPLYTLRICLETNDVYL